ncbi:MAG: hypothetical protein ACTHMI_16865 [Mucilaginibacter sp.]
MKTLAIMILFSINAAAANYDIVAVRTAYAAAARHRSGLACFRQILAAAPENPVITCYRGAAEMMEARYAVNPIRKLSAFNKGKQMIETGIAADSNNVECRFIRYGIQRNLPAMLSYNHQLKTDSTMIVQRLDTIEDQDLKKRILNFMKQN